MNCKLDTVVTRYSSGNATRFLSNRCRYRHRCRYRYRCRYRCRCRYRYRCLLPWLRLDNDSLYSFCKIGPLLSTSPERKFTRIIFPASQTDPSVSPHIFKAISNARRKLNVIANISYSCIKVPQTFFAILVSIFLRFLVSRNLTFLNKMN